MEFWTCIGLAVAAAMVAYGWGRHHAAGVVVYAEVDAGKKGFWRWSGYDAKGQRRSSGFPRSFQTSQMALDDVKYVHPGIKVTIIALLLAVLASAGPAEAQGLRETLEGIGRQVAGEVVRDAADRIDGGEPAPEPAAAAQPVRQVNVSAPPVEVDPGLSTDTIVVLFGLGIICLLLLVVMMTLMGRNQSGQEQVRSLSLQDLGDKDEEEVVKEIQNLRFASVRWLFSMALVVALTIQILETLAETFYPGLEDTLMLVQILAFTAVIVFFALLLLFGPITRDVFPSITWKLLVWGNDRKMPVAVRVALIYVFGAIAVTTMLVAATFAG